MPDLAAGGVQRGGLYGAAAMLSSMQCVRTDFGNIDDVAAEGVVVNFVA